MKNKLLRYAFIVSTVGFLFGFDSVVISGVNLPLKSLWESSDWFHGTFIISISLWGTVVGALLGGYPTERLGRKSTVLWVGVFFTVSAIGSALVNDPYSFSFFRFVGGLGAGVGSIAAPAYISEIATARDRGKLGMLFQFNIVFGILMAFLSNYLLDGTGGEDDWRWMLGIELVPALLFTVFIPFVPESPRWLIVSRNRYEEGRRVLTLSMSKSEAEQAFAQMLLRTESNKPSTVRLFSGKYRQILMISFLMAFFNQFSGISFVLFYAPEILEKAGLATSDSLLSSVSVGLVNLIFTFVGIYLIDRAGRKLLMYIGSVGYIISLFCIAYGFYFSMPAMFKLIFMLLFIASHAVGQGAVIWVFLSEIFPNEIRSFGQAWGSGLLNVFAAIIALFGAVLINSFAPWIVFVLFAGFMVLQLLFTHFIMPETKGVSLEDLERKLVK
ncbi:sugar porter family MFS transporter [Echinicola marina]|uniref:sugar porter family MFS transporter n=1 Tax=Echinicola marina TaxID=2859768 RepID=UPI001CF63356|nr:sugar porter family MFS transporter [Echinicola marina]UCS93354.1 sugar porter family MFS transporter [Echinicola marina]